MAYIFDFFLRQEKLCSIFNTALRLGVGGGGCF